MKIETLMRSTLADMVSASLQLEPELHEKVPVILADMRKWANSKGYSLTGVLCACINYLATQTDEMKPNENELIN